MLEKFNCIDVSANGKPVKLDVKNLVAFKRGIKYLFDLLPRFYCKTFKEDASKEKLLKKPQVFVWVAKPSKVIHNNATSCGEAKTILGSI